MRQLTLSNAPKRRVILQQLARLRVNSNVIKDAFALGTVCIVCTEIEQRQHSISHCPEAFTCSRL